MMFSLFALIHDMMTEEDAEKTSIDDLGACQKPIPQKPVNFQWELFPTLDPKLKVKRQKNLLDKQRGAPHRSEHKPSSAFHVIRTSHPASLTPSPLTDSDLEDEQKQTRCEAKSYVQQADEQSMHQASSDAKETIAADDENHQPEYQSFDCEI